MLQITSVTVNGAKGGCVTDERAPRIAFSLSSDRQGEALSSAVITVGDWKRITYDQLNNRYDGPLAPFTEYGVRVKAVGTSGDMAEAENVIPYGKVGYAVAGEMDNRRGLPDAEQAVSAADGIPKVIPRRKIPAACLAGVYGAGCVRADT